MSKVTRTAVQLDFDLLEVIACPHCHKALEIHTGVDANENELVCPGCVKRYLIKNQVPCFVRSVHTPEFRSQYQSTESLIKARLGERAHRILWKFYRNPLVTTAESRHVETKHLLELLSPDARVLNLGSGQFSKDSALFRQYKTRMVNLDIAPFGDVHITADAHELPFFDEMFDLVYLSHVLEHVRDANVVVQECHRVLKPGGYLYSMTPFVSRFHSDSDYRRWTLMGLDYLFRDFKKISSGIRYGPGSAVALALREFFPLFLGSGYLYLAAKFLAGWLLMPIACLDPLLVRNRHAHKLALAFYFLGQKKV